MTNTTHFDLLITNATVLTPNGRERLDIACRDGKIVALGQFAASQAKEVFDAKDLHVLPGVIDSQVHFREPGLTHKEDIESGTRGAVLGGVTAVFEMPNTNPLTLNANDLNAKLNAAKNRAWCDYAFYIGGSAVNASQLATLEQLPGCCGVKVFMGSSFGDLLASEDAVLSNILSHGQRRMAIHAEDEMRLRERKVIAESSRDVRDHPNWRDVQSALQATQRIVALAKKTGRPLHILHISTREEIAFLAEHKRRVSVEVLPHHLTMSAPECYERLGTLAQMNPPVRGIEHQDALWKGVREGVVDVLGSDHAPHTLEEKNKIYPESPSGMTGVQTLVPIMLDHVHHGRLSLERFVDLTSAGVARLFGLAGKGRIALGYDADFTIVDLHKKKRIENKWIASKVAWTPYDGKAVNGWPIATIVRANIIMREDQLLGSPQGDKLEFWQGTHESENKLS